MRYEVFGDPEADVILLQMVDVRDLEGMTAEIQYIQELSGKKNFLLAAVVMEDWNADLSPWPAPAVYGKENFTGRAEETLAVLCEEVLPAVQRGLLARGEAQEGSILRKSTSEVLQETVRPTEKPILIGGYSLAGLFALWAAGKTELFSGVAAVSPSVWYPGFLEYAQKIPPKTKTVYLSLGDTEEKARNPVMAQVGDAIRSLHTQLVNEGCDCTLEWNPGNHFREPELRMAKGFAYLLKKL